MSIITWNCQGASNKKFPSLFKSIVSMYKAEIFVLVEPRISGTNADNVIKKLGFLHSHRVEASGFSGGIWILWSSKVSINVLVNQVQFIHMEVSWPGNNLKFLFTAIYGSPQLQFRKFLWHDLDHLASNISSPWLLAGDFNAILHQDERRGGSVHRARGCSFFNKFLHSNGLVDLEFSGPRFTWRRGSLLMRLDRAVCNTLWLQLFPNSSVDHLPKIMSDHRPIMIKLGLCHLSGPVDPPFKFLAAWLSHSDFSSIVHRIWQSGDDLMACIDSFKSEIQKWNVETFGHIGRRKRRLFRRLNGIQTKLENSPDASSTFLSDLETSLREEMEEVCFQEELLWLQKSSSDWLCLGDRNTNYYHMKALIRKKRNFISQLKSSDGSWINEEDQLSHLACNYFSDLYSLDVPSFIPLSLNGAFPSLSDHALMRLNIPAQWATVGSSVFSFVRRFGKVSLLILP
ncbi:hypothetical protein K1719_043358 [Acacia pycnantha]|nr:hypothetical protein K1719_043358 [Acacia pycnantha]